MSTPAARASAAELAPISTYMFSMSLELGIVLTRAVQVNGDSGDDAINPFAARGANFHGLRGIERVENRRKVSSLRQALQAQVAVVGDSADDEARLVNRRDDQATRRAAADGDDHVAEIVHDGMERRELRANFFGELLFIAGDGGRLDKFLQIAREVAWNFRRAHFCVCAATGKQKMENRKVKIARRQMARLEPRSVAGHGPPEIGTASMPCPYGRKVTGANEGILRVWSVGHFLCHFAGTPVVCFHGVSAKITRHVCRVISHKFVPRRGCSATGHNNGEPSLRLLSCAELNHAFHATILVHGSGRASVYPCGLLALVSLRR